MRTARTRDRRLAAGVLALVWVAALGGVAEPQQERAAPGPFAQLDPRYRMSDHQLIVIDTDALKPARATLAEGQLVAWINYAPDTSEIVFERAVARSMICHSLVNFAIRDGELRSSPIRTGEFASFCQLKPGRYGYRVVRPALPEGAAGPPRVLEGEIVVGSPAASPG